MRSRSTRPSCSPCCSPGAGAAGAAASAARQLGRPRARLRPRGRDERLRRLRLRPARQGLPLHPRPLLHGDDDRDARQAARRPRPARHLRAATSASAAPPAPAAWRSTRRAATRRTAPATRSCCAAPAANRWPTAAASCAPPAAGGSRSPASAPTAAPSRRCRPKATPARSTSSTRSPVDQYVKGVIPNESPPSWPTEELKAQAVASRSFALTAGVGGNGFDLYADTRSQVYKGLESEYATHQRRRRRDPRPGRRVPGQGRRDPLLRLLRRPHREHPERLRRPRSPTCRRPRPLRLLLPAAHLDAEIQRPGNQLQAQRLPRRAAEAGRHHQDRRLPADHRPRS